MAVIQNLHKVNYAKESETIKDDNQDKIERVASCEKEYKLTA